jgi:hypothetical protein
MDHMALSRYVTLREMQGCMTYLTKCVGLPLKKAFIVEPPRVMMWLFNVVKMFLKEKMRNRIGMYSSSAELCEFVQPASMLPTILGGDLEDANMFDWMYRQVLLDRQGTH